VGLHTLIWILVSHIFGWIIKDRGLKRRGEERKNSPKPEPSLPNQPLILHANLFMPPQPLSPPTFTTTQRIDGHLDFPSFP
jgi:hypothetical protein